MARPAQPEDLYRLRIATEPRLAPDGSRVAFTVQEAAPRHDGYRHSVWVATVPVEGRPVRPRAHAAPRQVTTGGLHDRGASFSPDGRWLAFLSDRPATLNSRPAAAPPGEDSVQVWLLPLDGGDARRLTDLPRGATAFAWSPTGEQLIVSSSSRSLRKAGPADAGAARGADEPPTSDFHYIDRLNYMFNGAGFTYHRRANLWLVEAETGSARRLTAGATDESRPAWSPDGTRIAFAANRRRNPDLVEASDIFVMNVRSGRVTQVTGGPVSFFGAPAWLPDGRTLATIGHRFTAHAGTRSDVWLFAADGSDAGRNGGRNLSARHDLMLAAMLANDLAPGAEARLAVSADGTWITFSAPNRGAYELWRIATTDGRLEQLTDGRHYVSGWDAVSMRDGRTRLAWLQADPTHPSDLYALDVPARRAGPAKPRRLTTLNEDALADIALVEAVERRWEVDGRSIQGWLYPAVPAGGHPRTRMGLARARASTPPPLLTEIHGGPHAFYGWAPTWEFQVLAGAGISVLCCNPRGSDGYGEAFNAANYRDWGDGPMRDVLAGIDGLVADGLADPERLGLTGGSYGGYLTTWTIGHDQRFRAAMTCRSVSDMEMLMLTGDISGGLFGRLEFGSAPWEDPDYYRAISPLTYAAAIRTPLLIQHSEKDLRTTIAQAEALFTVLRSLRRPVRLMRVPEETHELTRSGTPFRRVENLVQVRDWFRHFLLDGRSSLPPLPRHRAGR